MENTAVSHWLWIDDINNGESYETYTLRYNFRCRPRDAWCHPPGTLRGVRWQGFRQNAVFLNVTADGAYSYHRALNGVLKWQPQYPLHIRKSRCSEYRLWFSTNSEFGRRKASLVSYLHANSHAYIIFFFSSPDLCNLQLLLARGMGKWHRLS
jgi:hypothetical protein